MPRPPRNKEAGQRGYLLRMSDEEWEAVDDAIELSGMTKADWMRTTLIAKAKRDIKRSGK